MSVVGDKAMFETIEYQIKYDELPKFKDIQYSFKVAIQDAQQEVGGLVNFTQIQKGSAHCGYRSTVNGDESMRLSSLV